MSFSKEYPVRWQGAVEMSSVTFVCGYCGDTVGGSKGWYGEVVNPRIVNAQGRLYICPRCTCPTFLLGGVSPGAPDYRLLMQNPLPRFGQRVEDLPDDVAEIYAEARSCMGVEAYTAATMLCRKLLMHVAASRGAKSGGSFVYYVGYLVDNGHVAAENRNWVDSIRNIGNEANHELSAKTKQDAEALLEFSEMLLKTVYEYPARAARRRPVTSSPPPPPS